MSSLSDAQVAAVPGARPWPQPPAGNGPGFVVVADGTLQDWQASAVRLLREQGDLVHLIQPGHGLTPDDDGRIVLDLRDEETEQLEAGRREVWRIHSADPLHRAGTTALLAGALTVGIGLEVRSPSGDGRIVIGGRYAVVPTSAAETTARLLAGAATFPARLSRRRRLGVDPDREVAVDLGPPASEPFSHQRLDRKLRRARRRKRFRDAFTDGSWAIGVVRATVDDVLAGRLRTEDIDWHPGTLRDTYLADPFPLTDPPPRAGAELTVFAEEFDHITRHGRLVTTTYAEGRGWSGRKLVRDSAFHMSYPCLVRDGDGDGDGLYCMPEIGWNGTVSLYNVEHDHTLTGPVDLLRDVLAGDPTPVRWGDHWWIFYTDCAKPRDTDLYLWYSSGLTGPWQPHPMNPVKSDVISSRPAGLPLVHDGRLLRPAQNDAGTYGRCMVINEVEVLTPTDFAEKTLAEVGPFGSGPYRNGPHTLSVAGPYLLLDGKRRVPTLMIRFRRLLRRLFSGRSRPAG